MSQPDPRYQGTMRYLYIFECDCGHTWEMFQPEMPQVCERCQAEHEEPTWKTMAYDES